MENIFIKAVLRLLNARNNGDVAYLHIGANDGITLDPVADTARQCGWSGILVEPVPHVFSKLAENYQGYPQTKVVNCAVGAERGTVEFFVFDAEIEKYGILHSEQLGSMRKESLLNLKPTVGKSEDYIKSILVECKPVDDVLADAGCGKLDLVVIDAEGCDYDVLRLVPIERMKPPVIIYENPPAEPASQARSLLQSCGYAVTSLQFNTIAIHPDLLGPQAVEMLDWLYREAASLHLNSHPIVNFVSRTGTFVSYRNDSGQVNVQRVGDLTDVDRVCQLLLGRQPA